jgi:hypothetical protein
MMVNKSHGVNLVEVSKVDKTVTYIGKTLVVKL